MVTYVPGTWFAVVGEQAAVLVPSTEAERAGALWELVQTNPTPADLLDVFLREGVAKMPSFGLVSWDETGYGVILRGPVRASVGGGEPVDGNGVNTWAERRMSSGALQIDVTDQPDVPKTALTISIGVVLAGSLSINPGEAVEKSVVTATPEAAAVGGIDEAPDVETGHSDGSADQPAGEPAGEAAPSAAGAGLAVGAVAAGAVAGAVGAAAASGAMSGAGGAHIADASQSPTDADAGADDGVAGDGIADDGAETVVDLPAPDATSEPGQGAPDVDRAAPDEQPESTGDDPFGYDDLFGATITRRPEDAAIRFLDESGDPTSDPNEASVTPSPEGPPEGLPENSPPAPQLGAPDPSAATWAPPADSSQGEAQVAWQQPNQGWDQQQQGWDQNQSWGQQQQGWDQNQSWGQQQQGWDQNQSWDQQQQGWDQNQSWGQDADEHDGLTVHGGQRAQEVQAQQQQLQQTYGQQPAFSLHFSQGDVIELDRTVIVGRAPEARRFGAGEQPRLVVVQSPQLEVSGTHLELRPEQGKVAVTDLNSTNGTTLVTPGAPPVRLNPGEPILVAAGALVDLGDGVTVAVVAG